MTKSRRVWRRQWRARWHQPHVRLAVWLDALIVDHGLLRPLWNRPQRFAKDAWRANQPGPIGIRRLAKKGIHTIVNLRGSGSGGAILLEEQACDRYGVELIHVRMSSRGAPSKKRILAFADLVQQLDTPVLFHCKSGADRSGFAAGLYLLLTGQGDVADAKAQLTWRNLHFKGAKTGLLHEFFCAYERYQLDTDSAMSFLDWVAQVYDPDQLEQSFKPRRFSAWLVDKVLRRE
ncbi:tyrosine-protein phosphatase [Saccharospirillum sp. MSK14-1]|uniref:fused DSP-PTPase phosphatase/NAD kinase-like protein n=1 Tax=Saccharospirillum sp. MSK14-1 TaxID=1897632 RepID=UPI000D36F324|nr:tyrosine-protein phosphatase [Saccharospirillum sp. MSK14-1]